MLLRTMHNMRGDMRKGSCGAVEMHISEKVSIWRTSKSSEGFEVAEEMSNGPEVAKAPISGAYLFPFIPSYKKGTDTQ